MWCTNINISCCEILRRTHSAPEKLTQRKTEWVALWLVLLFGIGALPRRQKVLAQLASNTLSMHSPERWRPARSLLLDNCVFEQVFALVKRFRRKGAGNLRALYLPLTCTYCAGCAK